MGARPSSQSAKLPSSRDAGTRPAQIRPKRRTWFAYDCEPLVKEKLWHWTLIPVRANGADEAQGDSWLSVVEDRRSSATSTCRLVEISNSDALPKRLNASCRCKTLERTADEPDCPVAFDPALNEYNLEDRRGGSWRIRYCFFCGGTAPRSKRSSHFATIPASERQRLHALTTGFADLDAVIARFGKPDEDLQSGTGEVRYATENRGTTSTTYRTLRYHDLSTVANVEFVDYGPTRGVLASLTGKYIGPLKPPLPDDGVRRAKAIELPQDGRYVRLIEIDREEQTVSHVREVASFTLDVDN